MKIHLVSPALPPIFDGIGDYSAHIAKELVASAQVTILTTTAAPCDPIAGVRIVPSFDPRRPRSVRNIGKIISEDRPDWVVLQFNQFSYGRWGLNPWLPLVLRNAVRKNPGCRLAVMFHEDFVPPTTWKFAIMRQWQRWQFKALGRAAHLVFFSIDPWVRKYGSWFPGKPVLHLPVGSNIPKVQISRQEARDRLGIKPDKIVLGLFGLVNGGRNAQWLAAAVEAAKQSQRDVVLLYIGAHGQVVRSVASGIPIIADGPFPGDEVSRRLAAIDVFLSPLGDGVSTRRGSMMAGLQHGLPTVGTRMGDR